MVCVNRELDDDRIWSPGRYEGIRERTRLDVASFEEPEFTIEEVHWYAYQSERIRELQTRIAYLDMMILIGACGLAGMLFGALLRLL